MASKSSSSSTSQSPSPPPPLLPTAQSEKQRQQLPPALTTTAERNLITKIDVRVIPCLCLLYLLAFLDRVNIANANTFGLSTELGLASRDSVRYNTALVIFFVPYILFEIPSNILIRRFKPNVWLSGCMFFFGLTTICQGLVQNYSGLLATRFFLGVFESGMFPGCFYLIGMWYRRHEAQRRFSFFFGSTTLAGAFGGLLASAIGKMDHARGYRGWRWIFIIEGAATVVASAALFFAIPNFPQDAAWLTGPERAFVRARLRLDQGHSNPNSSHNPNSNSNSPKHSPTSAHPHHILRILRDPKVLINGFTYLGIIVSAYGYAYFSPAIIRAWGYSPIETQLRSVPPWAAAFGFSMAVAYLSDRLRHRFLFVLLPMAVAVAGFAILLAVHDNLKVQYAGLFLVTCGTYSAAPIVVCWFNMNLGGHRRRSVGSAWQIAFGNIGGVIAVFVFLDRHSPRYVTGYSVCVGFVCLGALASAVYFVLCLRENRTRERLGGTAAALGEDEKIELGDLSPDYRYLL